ncbi:glutathione-dependent formaldehyde-activating enzyme [Calycina marina]|uniref:Glutathione-dependent formaldehyde-activating enzyme n=1 Tax=Calycina marina TaxID=1763456 RepID=A0A9P7Z5Y3_9HELO|nr:glutathione-dependent formaldehyde-activating enzyme [Calycina marina]
MTDTNSSKSSSGGKETQVTTGSCLCGNAKYTVTGAALIQVLCHCLSCKKASGSVFGANGMYKKTQINLQPGSEKSINVFEDKTPESGAIVSRSFCGNCGSPLFLASSKHPENVTVTSGTMDLEDGMWKPKMEFYCKRKPSWMNTEGTREIPSML